jgi:hypothetical protein
MEPQQVIQDTFNEVIRKGISDFLSIYGSTALVDLGRFFSFLICTQSIGLLGWRISPSQGRYLHRKPQTQNTSSAIRTHDPSVRTGEDGSCLRLRGRCDLRISELQTVYHDSREGEMGQVWP